LLVLDSRDTASVTRKTAAYATLSQRGEGNRPPALSLRRLTGKSIPIQMPASDQAGQIA